MKYKKAFVDISIDPFSIWFRHLNPYGIKLQTIVEQWLKETESDFTDLSLVNFINAKMPDCAMTEQQFDELDPKKKKFLN